MKTRKEMPPPPVFPDLPIDPNAPEDDVIFSEKDKAFFQSLTDERIDEILAAETDPESGLDV